MTIVEYYMFLDVRKCTFGIKAKPLTALFETFAGDKKFYS